MSLAPTMALESPLLSSSPGNIMSAFSPYTDFSLSPNSPAMNNSPRYQTMYVNAIFKLSAACCLLINARSARNSQESSHLRPNSIDDNTNGLQMTSPSDMVGPSPVTSNGTETTEIEDEVADDVQAQEIRPSPPRIVGSADSQATVGAANKIRLHI